MATIGDVQPLNGLGHRLGRNRFESAAGAAGLDEESVTRLNEMLDQQEGKTTGPCCGVSTLSV